MSGEGIKSLRRVSWQLGKSARCETGGEWGHPGIHQFTLDLMWTKRNPRGTLVASKLHSADDQETVLGPLVMESHAHSAGLEALADFHSHWACCGPVCCLHQKLQQPISNNSRELRHYAATHTGLTARVAAKLLPSRSHAEFVVANLTQNHAGKGILGEHKQKQFQYK